MSVLKQSKATNDRRAEMKNDAEMSLTLYELSAYNDGRLVPHTFDLTFHLTGSPRQADELAALGQCDLFTGEQP